MENIKIFIADNEESTMSRMMELFEVIKDLGIEVVGYANDYDMFCKMKELPKVDVIVTVPFLANTPVEKLLSFSKESFPNAKVMMMLDRQTKILEDVLLKKGVDDILLKPFKVKTLVEKIQEMAVVTDDLVEKEDMGIDLKFKALSDGTRRKVLDLLRENTLTASELAEACETTKPNISQHLDMLYKSGLVEREKKGLYVYFSLKKEDMKKTNREVSQLLNIKDKILQEVKEIANEKKCETVVGATDSQDEGIFYIMKKTKTLVTFHYSFRLSSFIIEFENPSYDKMNIHYQDTKAIESFLAIIRNEVQRFYFEEEKKKEEKEEKLNELKSNLVTELAYKTSGMNLFLTKNKERIQQLHKWINEFIDLNYEDYFTEEEKQKFVKDNVLNIISVGKIHHLIEDSSVSEIMINAHDEVWIEQYGKFVLTDIVFENEGELMDLARKIVGQVGRRIDNSNPIVDARLPDGSRVHIVIPPISTRGVTITIRKFFQENLKMEDLIEFDTISQEAANFLTKAVKARANIIVSGGTGSGKTSTLNILSNNINDHERVVVIEDQEELQLDLSHVVKLEARPANSEGCGEVTTRDLVKASMRMAPERVVLAEARDGVIFDFLQLCNTGHDGSMTSIHANNPEACLSRMENLMLQTGLDIPTKYIRQTIADSVDIIVQIQRLKDGSRKITRISQVVGYDENIEQIEVEDIFTWNMTGLTEIKKLKGEFHYTGSKLTRELMYKFDCFGIDINQDLLTLLNPTNLNYVIEEQLPEIIEELAYALKSGYVFGDALKIMAKNVEAPFDSKFLLMAQEIEAGKRLKTALKDFQERVNHPDVDLFCNTLNIQFETGGQLEPTLRQIISILEERREIRKAIPYHRQLEYQAKPIWKLTEFVELLSLVSASAKNFEDALKWVCSVTDNEIQKEFEIAVIEIQTGRKRRDALKDLVKRVDIPEMRSLVLRLIQTEEYGVPIHQVLKTQLRKLHKTLKELSQFRS